MQADAERMVPSFMVPESYIEQLDALFYESTRSDIEISPPALAYNIERAIKLILNYFHNASKTLQFLVSREEVRTIYEDRQLVKETYKCVMQTSEYLPKFMSTLELIREAPAVCATSTTNPQSTTNPASLARSNTLRTVKVVTTGTLLQLANQIETAIAQWHSLHGLTIRLRDQISIAEEWAEFHEIIMPEIEQEIKDCFKSLYKIDTPKHNGPMSLSLISEAIRHSPSAKCKKIPFQSEEERANIFK